MGPQVIINSFRSGGSKGTTRGAQKGAKMPRNQQERGKGVGWRIRDIRLDEAKKHINGMVAAKPARCRRSMEEAKSVGYGRAIRRRTRHRVGRRIQRTQRRPMSILTAERLGKRAVRGGGGEAS